MPRQRLPQGVAETTGAATINPGRFKDRKFPKPRPIGEPYARMNLDERRFWHECVANMPWLDISDRGVLLAACRMFALLESNALPIGNYAAFRTAMADLGATPTSRSKVMHAAEKDDESEDDFFSGPRAAA